MYHFIKKSILVLSMYALAANAQAGTVDPAFELNLKYEKNMLANSGASNLTSAYRLFNFAEHAVAKEFDIENPTIAKLARASRILLLDLPVASLTMITQHEYFGHGGRLRDIGIKNISYEINIASGVTKFSAAQFAAQPRTKRAAVSAGGMESTTLMATNIYNDWFNNGAVNSSDAVLGAILSYDIFDYINSTSNSSTANNPAHDVMSYINHINNWNGRTVLTASSLRSKNVVNLLNPFVFFGLYSVGNYIDTGERDWELPCIDISGAKYLPAMSLYLAPWGPEYHLNNFIKDTTGRTYKLTARYGKTGGKKGSGIGFTAHKIYYSKKFSIDGNAELWRQPKIDTINASTANEKTGWMVSAKLNYAISKDFHANVQAGYKKAGFVPGETLSAGAIIKAGVFFRI